MLNFSLDLNELTISFYLLEKEEQQKTPLTNVRFICLIHSIRRAYLINPLWYKLLYNTCNCITLSLYTLTIDKLLNIPKLIC